MVVNRSVIHLDYTFWGQVWEYGDTIEYAYGL